MDQAAPSLTRATGSSGRIESLDLFRGLTILAMIWVNDLARVRNMPPLLKHAPESADAMTFPDVVFPAFLFIVGMAIPIALGNRLARGEALPRLLLHLFIRTAGLLAIGVLMVNIPAIDPAATGLTRSQWSVLMYLGVILAWNAYPSPPGGGRRRAGDVFLVLLRFVGIALLIVLATVYRGRAGGETCWLRTQWWGILGLIGWAYLTATLGYLLVRGHPAGVAGLVSLGLMLCIADKNGTLGRFAFARHINDYVSLGGHIGGHGAIVLAGVLAMLLIRPPAFGRGAAAPSTVAAPRHRSALQSLLIMAAMLLVAGILLRRPYGMSKNQVTPAWCLYCAAICCVAYAFLYWLVDVRGFSRGLALIRLAGNNALLAFILPGIIYGLLDILKLEWVNRYGAAGLPGLIRSSLFALAVTAMVALLTRVHIRLRL